MIVFFKSMECLFPKLSAPAKTHRASGTALLLASRTRASSRLLPSTLLHRGHCHGNKAARALTSHS